MDRSNWRSIQRANIGLSIIGVFQLLLGGIATITLVVFLRSGSFPRAAEALGLLPAIAVVSVLAALPVLLFVSGVGLFIRSFFLGFLPALASAALMLLVQGAAAYRGQPLKLHFVIYPIVVILLLLTRYRSALSRDPL